MGPVPSATDDDDLLPGRRLGPYELVMRIGVGGMARVWAARHAVTGEIVALKMLLPQLETVASFQEMFLDEARIASRIRHPNVCTTFALAAYDGILTLAMEWVDGASLIRMLVPSDGATDDRRVPIPFRHAARIIAETCAGLHAAHELHGDDGRSLGVVHRDVSPHNVLITRSGEIKVTDFGVAKALGKLHMTIVGQVKGKLGYMSPEQLTGGDVDRRSDVFALGCVLYETTTGLRPFRGDHDPQVMTAIVVGEFEPPTSVMADYPPALEAIIARALASDPRDRFPSADRMRAALEEYLRTSGPPVEAHHIAALLHERAGTEIAARALALLPPAAPSGRTPGAESGSGAMEIHRRPGAPQTMSFASLTLAAALGAALGLGLLCHVRSSWSKDKPVVAVSAMPEDTAGIEPAAEPSATEDPARDESVLLHLEPAAAVVLVEGTALPPGTTKVPRPDRGSSSTIVVRADLYEDTIVIIDQATPDEIEVNLLPVAARTPAIRREAGKPVPVATASETAAESAPEMPPNPYE